MKEIVRCPCCDQQMAIEPHKKHQPWKVTQIVTAKRMWRNGMTSKVIGRLFGCSDAAIREIIRGTGRSFVPRITATVQRRDAA